MSLRPTCVGAGFKPALASVGRTPAHLQRHIMAQISKSFADRSDATALRPARRQDSKISSPPGDRYREGQTKTPHRIHRISRSSERKCQKMSGYVRLNRTPNPLCALCGEPLLPTQYFLLPMSGYFGGHVLQRPPFNHSCHKREAGVARSSRHLPTAFTWKGNGACMESGISQDRGVVSAQRTFRRRVQSSALYLQLTVNATLQIPGPNPPPKIVGVVFEGLQHVFGVDSDHLWSDRAVDGVSGDVFEDIDSARPPIMAVLRPKKAWPSLATRLSRLQTDTPCRTPMLDTARQPAPISSAAP